MAHPDDETIFFAGLVLHSPKDFHIICATDGNADGRGKERKEEFKKACLSLGADSFEMLDFPDVYERRLDVVELAKRLKDPGKYEQVFTHNPLGEYGHPHHQDVCKSVYEAFEEEKIFTTAYNCFPSKKVELGAEEFKIKARALVRIYGEETQRFLNILPIGHTEGFVQVSKREVDSIYAFLTAQSEKMDLDKFKHLEDFIANHLKDQKRLF